MQDYNSTDLYELYFEEGMAKYRYLEDRQEAYYRGWAHCMERYRQFLCKLEDKIPEVKQAVEAECSELSLSN